jgi:hypothetical protein
MINYNENYNNNQPAAGTTAPAENRRGTRGFRMKFLGDKQILFSLSRTAVVFFLGLCLFSLFLYAAGVRQEFTDGTQLFLLGLSRDLGLILSACSFLGILFCVFPGIRLPRLRLALRIGSYLFLCAFGVLVNLLVSFIIAAAEGNR